MADPGNRTPRGQFKKGVSGNPNGRPKGPSITNLIILELLKTNKHGQTKAELLAAKLVELGLAGDMRAAQEIINRLDGKVPDRAITENEVRITERKLPKRGSRPDA